MSWKWKNFIRGTTWLDNGLVRKKINSSSVLNGQEIKTYYEEVVSKTATASSPLPISSVQNVRKKSSRTARKIVKTESQPWTLNRFFKAAQDNDVLEIKSYIGSGGQVNVQDSYGWTALMCAACNNAVDSVEALIEHGADREIRDKSGKTVWDLLRKHNDKNILDALQGREKQRPQQPPLYSVTEATLLIKKENFYCDTCNLNYTDSNHITSTVHVMNVGKKETRTQFTLPESNVGFQLMLRTGWDQEKGLGPEGTGLKYPVKTVLKIDRKGLGIKGGTKPRVTHFKPFDTAAVKTKMIAHKPALNKKQMQREVARDRRKEVKLRRMLM